MRNPLCCGSVPELSQYRTQELRHEWAAAAAYITNCSIHNECLRKGGNMYCSLKLILPPAQICNFVLHAATSSIFLPPLPRESDAKQEQQGPSVQEGGKKNKKAKPHKSAAEGHYGYRFCYEHFFHICVMMPLQWNKPVTQEVHFTYCPQWLTPNGILAFLFSHKCCIFPCLLFAILNTSKLLVPSPFGGPEGIS